MVLDGPVRRKAEAARRRSLLSRGEEPVCIHRSYRLIPRNAGERDVVFPAGTVRMRLRHKVMTEPVPLDRLLVAYVRGKT